MYSGWRNWTGFPAGWFVRNPMYDDPDVVQGPDFWQMRRRKSSFMGPTIRTEDPKPEEKPPTGSLRDLDNHVGRFSTEVTSAHGFSHIYTATSIYARVIWTVIVLVAIGTFIWQMEGLVSKFLEFDTVTEVEIVNRAKLEFPAITVCNTNKFRRSAIAKSQHRHVLYVDDLTPLPYYIPCQEDDFLCDRGDICVRYYLKCDGVDHCGDFSDERNCTYGNCGNDDFKCNKGSGKGYCISSKSVCDGVKDCYDGEDEWDCECRTSEYKCFQRGGCIRRSKVCDGTPDCLDNSDEEECPNPVDPEDCEVEGGFLCPKTFPPECITLKFLCDGYKDCPDGEDEPGSSDPLCLRKPTDPPEPCSEDEFDCKNGKCVPSFYRCDQQPDCSNNEDEKNCGRARCEDYQHTCSNNWQCVDEEFVCDYYPDCEGEEASDEKNCNCKAETGEDVLLFSVNCNGQLSEVENAGSDEVDVYVKCYGKNEEFPNYRHYREFKCEGTLSCADKENMLPQTCTSVLTDCYVNTNGADYKGNVETTENDVPCRPWNTALAGAYGYTPGSGNFPLLGAHSFCRNPGGSRLRPWCFIEEEGEAISGPGSDPGKGMHWDFCTIPADDKQSTCHTGVTFDARLSEGRLEVKRGDTWGTVQDSTWDINDGRVICTMLGLGTAVSVSNSGHPADDSVPILIDFVDCQGAETTLLDCVFTLASSDANSDHASDVGVTCSGSGSGTRKKRAIDPGKARNRPDVYPANRVGLRHRHNAYHLRARRRRDLEYVDHIRRKRQSGDEEEGGEEEEEERTGSSYFSEIDFDFGSEQADDIAGIDLKDATYTCPKNGEVLPLWQVCNNIPDCPGGTDEVYCATELCELGYRPCRFEKKCIPTDRECDDIPDCNEYRLDEAFCTNITSCPPNYWLCPERPICIPRYYRCDTVNDCGNNMDENNCTFDRELEELPDPFKNPNWYENYWDLYNDPEVFDDFAKNYYKPNLFNRVKGEDPVDWKSFFTFSEFPDYQDLLDVLYLSREEIREYGHQFKDFVLECTYDESQCTEENFTTFETDDFGNCYTFNYNPGGKDVYSTKTGPNYGLRMILNLQQNEYISLTGPEAGVRVVINPRDVRPLPGEEGVTIKPGVVTSIGLRYENISRKGGLYGDCTPEDQKYKIIKDGTIMFSEHEAYDRQVCLQSCLHDRIQSYCDCSDTILLNGPRCKVTNVTQDSCKQLMYYLHHSDLLGCDCHQQCRTRTYTTTTSQSKWPSNIYRPHLLRYIHSLRSSTLDINDRTTVDDNLVRLQVFYEQLNYATTREDAAYSFYSLISDVGGTAGLYIGFSIITFIEFAILVYQLCRRVCCPWTFEDDEAAQEQMQTRPPQSAPRFAKDVAFNM